MQSSTLAPSDDEAARRASCERKRGKTVTSMGSLPSICGKFLSSKRDGAVSLQGYFKGNERWKIKLVDRHRVFLKSNYANKYLSVIAPQAMAANPQIAAFGNPISESTASVSLGSAQAALPVALAPISPVPNHVFNLFFIRPKRGKDAEETNKITLHAYDGRYVVIKDPASGQVALADDSLAQSWKYKEIPNDKQDPTHAGTPPASLVIMSMLIQIFIHLMKGQLAGGAFRSNLRTRR